MTDRTPIPLSSQDITEREIQAVVDVLRGNRLSIGPRTEAFESACAAASGRSYGVAVNSGTSALHLCVNGLGIGEGDEVITSPFSFVATTNCILFENATPVFVDIDPESYNMDPAATEAAVNDRTKALLPVEVFGNTAHFDTYESIAQRNELKMIEDSCEALGGRLGDRKAGSFGDAGTFAFYPNKQVTTGEGGMLVTDNEELRDMARALRNQGRHPRDAWLQHTYMGYNFRISEITAALGEVQLSRLDEIVSKRRAVSALYDEALLGLVEKGLLHLPPMAQRESASFFVYVIRLADRFSEADRDDVRAKLTAAGIGNNCYFVPIHYQPYIQERLGYQKGQFPVTEHLAARTIAIPFFSNMTESQVGQVVDTLTEILTA